jgi:hypothetical protein
MASSAAATMPNIPIAHRCESREPPRAVARTTKATIAPTNITDCSMLLQKWLYKVISDAETPNAFAGTERKHRGKSAPLIWINVTPGVADAHHTQCVLSAEGLASRKSACGTFETWRGLVGMSA